MKYKKAGLIERFIAALIDGIIASLLIYVPILGGIVSTVYILTKDAIAYEITKNPDFKNRSIGKKIMGIEIVNFDGQDVDWVISLKRNIPFAIGSVIAIVPIIGWVFGGIIEAIVAVVEILLLLFDKDGRRIGDKLANTQVVSSSELINKNEVIDI